MIEKLPKAIYGSADRPLRIGDLEIPCYVLEDGRRVLVQTGMIGALAMKQGTAAKRMSGDRLAKFSSTRGIKPFISNELSEMIKNPIRFRIPKGSVAHGYEATILADLCEAVLSAREKGDLHYQQQHIADRCELLVRGFARVGIIALVDEATGYQYERDRDELHRILAAYIAPELMPWAKRFPDEFYRHLFRLQGWQYSPLSVKRPIYAGKLTQQLIYEQLPLGVLDELKRKNPKDEKGRRKHKHFQFLTEDIGNPHLEKQIVKVVTLMQVSRNWRAFKTFFAQAHPGPQQGDMFPEKETEL